MDSAKLLQKLIQIPSFSGHEEKLASFIVEWAKKHGLPVEKQEGNVIIRLIGKSQNKALIFNAHMDTVKPGKLSLWSAPPIGVKAGVIQDGKLFGLGASDDKASIAVMLDLAKTIKPEYDLWFTFVCNEETDGSGTENFLQWLKEQKYFSKYNNIAAVIGEPTNLQKIEIGHRGNAFYQLSAYGSTGHSAKNYPEKNLAIKKMLKAIELLSNTFMLWKVKYKDEKLGEPSLNVTSINSNNNNSINKIPDKCGVTIDIRTTPKLHGLIDQLIREALGPEIIVQRIKSSDAPAVLTKKSQFLKLCNKLFPNLNISVSQGSTDLGQFLKAGIEGVVLGPGDYEAAHTVNEYVSIENLKKALEMYKKIIQNF